MVPKLNRNELDILNKITFIFSQTAKMKNMAIFYLSPKIEKQKS